jgi:exodeoxyribonuclease VII small subunit
MRNGNEKELAERWDGRFPAQEEKPQSDALPFEDAVAQLEEVVRDLEAGEIPLEAALARFEEGVRLSRYCLGVLDSAQGRIEQLVGELNGEPVLDSVEREFKAG